MSALAKHIFGTCLFKDASKHTDAWKPLPTEWRMSVKTFSDSCQDFWLRSAATPQWRHHSLAELLGVDTQMLQRHGRRLELNRSEGSHTLEKKFLLNHTRLVEKKSCVIEQKPFPSVCTYSLQQGHKWEYKRCCDRSVAQREVLLSVESASQSEPFYFKTHANAWHHLKHLKAFLPEFVQPWSKFRCLRIHRSMQLVNLHAQTCSDPTAQESRDSWRPSSRLVLLLHGNTMKCLTINKFAEPTWNKKCTSKKLQKEVTPHIQTNVSLLFLVFCCSNSVKLETSGCMLRKGTKCISLVNLRFCWIQGAVMKVVLLWDSCINLWHKG